MNAEARAKAVRLLNDLGDESICHRCGNGPGEPGCGKMIHEYLDEVYRECGGGDFYACDWCGSEPVDDGPTEDGQYVCDSCKGEKP